VFLLIYITMNIKTVLHLECKHGDVCATDQ